MRPHVEKRLRSVWAEPRESGDSLFLQRNLFVSLQTQVAWPPGGSRPAGVLHTDTNLHLTSPHFTTDSVNSSQISPANMIC